MVIFAEGAHFEAALGAIEASCLGLVHEHLVFAVSIPARNYFLIFIHPVVLAVRHQLVEVLLLVLIFKQTLHCLVLK